MNKKFSVRDAGFLCMIVVILLATLFALREMDASPAPTSAEIRSLIESRQVDYLELKDNTLTVSGLLEPGEYRFEMKYVPEGSGAGIMVSIMSIAAFCGITALRRRRGRPQKPVETERNDRAAACGAEAKEGAGREDT